MCKTLDFLSVVEMERLAWVLNAIESYNFKSPPPIVVLPLGTGNDLSRVLQWGGGFSVIEGCGGLSSFLHDNIDHVAVTMLDLWKVNITQEKIGGESCEVKSKFMMNYLDAQKTDQKDVFMMEGAVPDTSEIHI